MFDDLLNLLFPKPSMCLLCESPLNHLGLCSRCEEKYRKRKAFLGWCKSCHSFGRDVDSCDNCRRWQNFSNRSLLPYEKEVRESILKLKFQNEFWRGEAFGKLLSPLLDDCQLEIDCIIPIPLHKKRLKERGYNQSELIAKGLAKELEKKVVTNVLYRKVNTLTQSGLSHYERYQNVAKAFSVRNSHLIENKRILLVDDVMTTGATLFFAAKALYQHKAKKVIAITLANGIF